MYICRRELRKSSISGNPKEIEVIPVFPRQLGKTKAFTEMPRQLRKFVIIYYLIKNTSILENSTPLKS